MEDVADDPPINLSRNRNRVLYTPGLLAHNRAVPALDDSAETHVPVVSFATIARPGGHSRQLREIKSLVDAAGSPVGKIPVALVGRVCHIVAMTVKMPGRACRYRGVAIFVEAAS